MKPETLAQAALAVGGPARSPIAAGWHFVVDRFLLLPAGVLVALVWANVAPGGYFEVSQALGFAVNEVGMALFLGLMAQEVYDAVLPGGVLHSWRRWGVAVVGAGGGLLGAMGVYLAWVGAAHETVLAQAWPIACAVDLAAGYYVLKTVGARRGAAPFFLLLAAATNAVGLLVVALRPAGPVPDEAALLLLVAAVSLVVLLRRYRVREFWPYLVIGGGLSWLAFHRAGLHPALALIPLVPWLPHHPRRHDIFADRRDRVPVHRAEHRWNLAVQVVLFFFGLVNGGVLLHGYGVGTWALLAATLVGRPLGILASVGLARAAGMHVPHEIGWRDVAVIAMATSSGFTFALFFAAGVLPPGPVLAEIKLGALATVIGAVLTLGLARALRIGPPPDGARANREASWPTR
jgi:Na+:H+ antiporter, NhaA family